MIRLWLISGCLILVTLLFTSAAITVGTFRRESPALSGFGYCDGKPCWLGINMQSANVTEADTLLRANGYQTISGSTMALYQAPDKPCDVVINHEFGGEIINTLQLVNCHDLQFGDFMAVFGAPASVGVNGFCDWSLEYAAMFVYVDGQIAPNVGITQLLPDRPIVQIDFNPITVGMISSTSWLGFAPLWHYRQVDPFFDSFGFCP